MAASFRNDSVITRNSRSGRSVVGALSLAALVALSACSEREDILVGKREDIRDGTIVTDLPAAPVKASISLPAQKANSSWSGSIGSTRAAHAALSPAPQLAWSTKIGDGNSRKNRIVADPVSGGGLIYTMDANGAVSAVTAQGAVVWSFETQGYLNVRSSVSGGGMAYDDGVLYFSSGYGYLIALDAKSGAVKWSQRLGAAGAGAPLVRGSLVYVIGGDDTAWAIRKDTGKVSWSIEGTSDLSNIIGGPAPLNTGSYVVFAFGTGALSATFPQGGITRWTASVAGARQGDTLARVSAVTGAPVISGGRIFAANHSGRTVALDASTGEQLWVAREGAMDPVWPVGGSIFSVSDRNKLLRINAANGDIIWAADLPVYVKDRAGKRGALYAHYGPILAGGSLIVASSDGVLRFFDPATGALRRTVNVPGGAASGAIVVGQTLYVVGGKGELHAFR